MDKPRSHGSVMSAAERNAGTSSHAMIPILMVYVSTDCEADFIHCSRSIYLLFIHNDDFGHIHAL